MRQMTTLLSIRTARQGLLEITDPIKKWTHDQAVETGLLTVFCRHTSASLLIQENAATAVRRDLQAYFARIAPEDPSAYEHDDEGTPRHHVHTRTDPPEQSSRNTPANLCAPRLRHFPE